LSQKPNHSKAASQCIQNQPAWWHVLVRLPLGLSRAGKSNLQIPQSHFVNWQPHMLSLEGNQYSIGQDVATV
jgi:hypothetical protein